MRSLLLATLIELFALSTATEPSDSEEIRFFSYTPSPSTLEQEHHCVLFIDGTPIYVVGTYGMFGYFEGAFRNSSTTATTVFYEVSFEWAHSGVEIPASTTLTPKSGFATLTYQDNFTLIEGMFGGSATSDLKGSFGTWTASAGHPKQATDENLRRHCLLAKPINSSYRALLGGPPFSPFPTPPDGALQGLLPGPGSGNFSGPAGAVAYCPDGPRSTAANYTYIYPEDDPRRNVSKGNSERGTLAAGAVTFSGAGCRGIAGAWLATAGPRAGRPGTGLYVARLGAGLLGYTCDAASVGWPSACLFVQYGDQGDGACPPPAPYPRCAGG